MNILEITMDKITTGVRDAPLQACLTSLGAAPLCYLTVKGLQTFLSKDIRAPSYPPGPPRKPLFGALTSFPKDHIYQRFNEWAALYGDVVYAPVLGMNMVILNSHEVIHELLSKRPNTTAGRRIGYLVTDIMGNGWSAPFLQPGPHHSNQRKMLRRGIGPQRIGSYDSMVESGVAKLMARLEIFQGNPNLLFQHNLGKMVSRFTYGEKLCCEMGEDLVKWNLEIIDLVNEAFFGIWMVDLFHWLRFIPDWVSDLRFKQLGRECTVLAEKVRCRAYERGLELYKSGDLDHCILNDLLEEFGDDVDVQDATSTLFGAALDTTTGAIIDFVLSLFLHPEVSQRVFEEIRSVTHGVRLPQISDRASLPYTEAVFKEALRIRPFMPLGVPHVNTKDEVIGGYFIPKGTMIHQCVYSSFHDPRVWEDPDTFKPERFLSSDASERPNPLTVIFGYGMRVCPGMYLADRVAFHMVATVASLFNIVPLEGKKVPLRETVEWDDSAIQQPVGFECRFTVRDEKAKYLLNTVFLHD